MPRIKMPVAFEAAGVTLLDPALYRVRIVSYKLKTSVAGNEYILWTLKVIDSPEDVGKTLWYRTPLVANALGFLVDLCVAIGATWEEDFDPDDLVGATFTALVDQEKDQNGVTRNNCKPLMT